eukprot:m.69077 g.69077  ORF g.69077 m.69077 type:complete len:532 (-) comp12026_c0_seq2:6-1601(-)
MIISVLLPLLFFGDIPAFHPRPPCYNDGGPHDIAGTIYLQDTETWHVMAGCWSSGGWQHLYSKDLVNWNLGRIHNLGDSGGIVEDEDSGNVYAYSGANLNLYKALDRNLTEWAPPIQLIHTPHKYPVGPGDPILWKGVTDNKWYGAIADKLPSGGYEELFASANLTNETMWKSAGIPLFQNSGPLIPSIPTRPQVHEFVTPDYFGGLPGDAKANTINETKMFLTSSYGPGQQKDSIYNFVSYILGKQVDGETFVPNQNSGLALDWSCFIPSNTTPAKLDVATLHAGTQYGCCPKTAGTLRDSKDGRRVVFNWLQHGTSSHPAEFIENTLAFPRDLSLSKSGELQQRFVPELETLRILSSLYNSKTIMLQPGNTQLLPFASNQAEVMVTLAVNTNCLSGHFAFGIYVFANGTQVTDEKTAIGFNTSSKHMYIDRTLSGLADDADTRAGPWPRASNGTLATNIEVHILLDHTILEVIANNNTAMALYVHPNSTNTMHLGVFLHNNDDDTESFDSCEVSMQVTAWNLTSATLKL